VLLAELGLRGRIHEIEENLFFRRDHSGSSLRSFPDPRTRIVWFDPSRSARFAFHEWQIVLGYAGAVTRSPVTALESARCLATVVSASLSQWRSLLSDIKYAALGVPSGRSL
jgi:hypothetical protein